jgi:GGDEF domain-containing protein
MDRVEQVRHAISEINVRQKGRTLGSVSMSFGIASWSSNMDNNGEALIQAADVALYQAKRRPQSSDRERAGGVSFSAVFRFRRFNGPPAGKGGGPLQSRYCRRSVKAAALWIGAK